MKIKNEQWILDKITEHRKIIKRGNLYELERMLESSTILNEELKKNATARLIREMQINQNLLLAAIKGVRMARSRIASITKKCELKIHYTKTGNITKNLAEENGAMDRRS